MKAAKKQFVMEEVDFKNDPRYQAFVRENLFL